MELMSTDQAASHWGVSVSRARAILARHRIRKIAGYPAEQVRAVTLRQGARTDLETQQRDLELEKRIRVRVAQEDTDFTPVLDLMLDDYSPPLLAGCSDRIPSGPRTVRISGPLGSGKSVVAASIARGWRRGGREVIAVKSIRGPATALESRLPARGATVIDSCILSDYAPAVVSDGVLASITTALTERPTGIVVDDLPPGVADTLVPAVMDLAANHGDAAVAVPVFTPGDTPRGVRFDTEIVLPGNRSSQWNHVEDLVTALSSDPLTQARLFDRMQHGSDRAIRVQTDVRNLFSPGSSGYRYLDLRIRQVPPQPPLGIQLGGHWSVHDGVMREPSGRLLEFTLPDLG